MAQRCAGKGYDYCDSCINAEFDPFQCDDCDNGSNYEGEDESEALTVHDLKTIMFKKAA